MGVYAVRQDMVDRYGEDALVVASDKDGTGIIDLVKVDGALQDAADEIDSYLSTRYALPLPSVPGVLKRICCDIALYRLSADAGVLTDEKRQRYDDAVRHLRAIAKGDANVGEAAAAPASTEDVLFEQPTARLFGRRGPP